MYNCKAMNTLQISNTNDYQIIQLNNGKVNAISLEMISELTSAINAAESDTAVRGVIITGQPHYFSAGLDIKELYHLDEQGSEEFWGNFLKMVVALNRFSKPLISAISGFSPAGGCVIAICCDFRYMASGDKYVIGLNEVPLAIMVTEGIFHLYAHWIGERRAHQYLMEGKLHSGQEALAMGLVDQLVPLDELLATAERKMQQLLRADDGALRGTKMNIKKQLLEKVDIDIDSILHQSVAQWWSPNARAVMKAAVEGLGGGK